MNEEKKRGDRSAQKRGIIIAFAVMLLIILIWYVIIPGVGALIKKIQTQDDDKKITSDYMDHLVSYLFYPANYDEDVFADEEYMKKDRSIAYTNGADTNYITEENAAEFGPVLVFFCQYFDTVINGRYEEYDAYFTDFYFENQQNKEKFTPQKLYSIKIENLGSREDGTTVIHNYTVEFKIMKNNGTFRNDIDSDSARKIVYEVIESRDGTVLINYIGAGLRESD